MARETMSDGNASLNTWADDLESHDITAGDEVTLKTDDGTKTVRADGEPDDNYWLELDIGHDGVALVVPDSSSETGVALVAGVAVRGTGHIDGKKKLADVYGIEAVN